MPDSSDQPVRADDKDWISVSNLQMAISHSRQAGSRHIVATLHHAVLRRNPRKI